MKQQDFLGNYNLCMSAASAAVAIMTLILSRGNFIAGIGAGIGTAVSVYVTNYRLVKKARFWETTAKDLIDLINGLETYSNSSR